MYYQTLEILLIHHLILIIERLEPAHYSFDNLYLLFHFRYLALYFLVYHIMCYLLMVICRIMFILFTIKQTLFTYKPACLLAILINEILWMEVTSNQYRCIFSQMPKYTRTFINLGISGEQMPRIKLTLEVVTFLCLIFMD